MQDNKEFLGTEPIGKLLVKLAIPTVIAQLINMLYNIVDRIYIGHIPGEGSLALTGVGVCMPLIMIVSAFAALVSAGGAPRASIFMGKQEHDMAEKTLGNCLGLQIIVSFVLTAILLLFNEELLLAFGASENTIAYATAYMNIYAIGTVFVQLTLGMNAFITAQGFTKISMVSVMIGAVCNIILDPIFIFGLHMGVRGAALATILSQAISCVWVVSFLCGKKTFLRIKLSNMRIDAKIILPCIALGMATFIMQSTESVISVCFNSSLLKYGGDIAVIELLPGLFVSIFTPDAALREFAAPALRVYMGGILLFGIQIACQMAFTSLGKAVNSIVVAVVRKIVLLIPLIYILPNLVSNKVMGVYLAEPVADVLAVTFTAILFAFQFKKAMKEIEN